MMAKSGLYAKGALGIKEPDAISIFAGGKSAMFWGGQWMRRSIRAALPLGFDLGIFPFPAVVAGGHKPVLSSVGITLTVNAWSKHPDLAFEMINGVTRNPAKAKAVTVPLALTVADASFDGDLGLRISARIATPASSCPGHAGAAGVRLYYGAASRDSRFDVGAFERPEVPE